MATFEMSGTAAISSKDNRWLKLARSLALKKYREQNGLFAVEGKVGVREALRSALQPEFVLYDAARADEPEIAALVAEAAGRCPRVLAVEPHLLAAVCQTENNQGVWLALRQPQLTAEAFAAAVHGRNIAVLDGLQDPGNVGTILRTAWAAGLGGVLLVGDAVDVYNPKVVRSAMGALGHLPVLALDDPAAADMLDGLGASLVVADAGGEDFRRVQHNGPVAWLMGREATGPSAFWRGRAVRTVAIPMQPGVDSLNVAVAAGILFFSSTN
ncbi:MAG: RNA methyltransferase [Firmicutes bacterium]|nr:RNA methyltransferase [Bacillota bacterium]